MSMQCRDSVTRTGNRPNTPDLFLLAEYTAQNKYCENKSESIFFRLPHSDGNDMCGNFSMNVKIDVFCQES